MSQQELSSLNFDHYSDTDKHGYLIEVDIHVPEHLHGYFNGFPPCPERMVITAEKSSTHQLECMRQLGISPDTFKRQTITATLAPKINYRCCNRLLALYVKLGCIVTKVHRGVRFRVAPFLAGYMKKLAGLRKDSSSTKFRNSIYKTMIVSSYGRMICGNYF